MWKTLQKRAFEETGLTAERLELFGIFSGKDMHYIYPNGDEVSNIDIVYICRDYTGTLRRQENEVEELKFLHSTKSPKNLAARSKTFESMDRTPKKEVLIK